MRLPTIVQLRLAPQTIDSSELTSSAPVLREADGDDEDEGEDDDGEEASCYYSRVGGKVLRFGRKGLLRAACRSAPSSPKRGSTLLMSPKRAVQSNEELDEWDAAPLIYCDSSLRGFD